MRTEYFYPFLFFFSLLLLQTTFIPLIAINGIVPDLILILLVFYAVRNGQIFGTVLGFIFGFLFDMITGSLLGSSMISKTSAGFVAGYFSNENKQDQYLRSYIFSLIVFLCALVDSVIYSFFSSIDIRGGIMQMLFDQGLFPGLYTALISIIIVIFHPKRSMS